MQLFPISLLSRFLVLIALLASPFNPIFAQSGSNYNYPTFHADRARTGWISNEYTLSPALIQSGQFGPVWNSPQFDLVTIGSTTYTPKMYASPLYIDQVKVSSGTYAGKSFQVVLAATTNGYIYAVNASTNRGVAAGTILWKTQLTTPEANPILDGGVPIGVLGTPIVDLSASPARVYVASDDVTNGWQVFALNLTSGSILPGWPLNINNTTLNPVNLNGPTTFQKDSAMSQRGALNLSSNGATLYVPFGGYSDGGAGWMIAVDTATPKLATAFAGAPSSAPLANGGMWASGGPALDSQGSVYSTTGNGTLANETTPGYWGNSMLRWGPSLTLTGTYTPFNYCAMDEYDTDLAGSAPLVLPDMPRGARTPHLVAFGGKQGNMYLLDRDNLTGGVVNRPGCSTDSTTDRSLLPPGGQTQFNGAAGPLNIFGPYSEQYENLDYAKSRATPAYFRDASNKSYLFATGSTKSAVDTQTTVPPCVVRLNVVTSSRQNAYLAIDRTQNSITMLSPGSPQITSWGPYNPVVWVLAANVTRSQNLLSPTVAHPILYALDENLNILWNSTQYQLNASGKYMIPAIARGTVFVGTDRIQAFGRVEAPATGSVVAINSGGSKSGAFAADTDYNEGQAASSTDEVDTALVDDPPPMSVYQTRRTGSNGVGFSYVIPNLRRGASYTVRLHFAEDAATAAGQRLFNVAINGASVLNDFDIYGTAGALHRAVVQNVTATADNTGKITIAFTPGSAGDPIVSGLEIRPISRGR